MPRVRPCLIIELFLGLCLFILFGCPVVFSSFSHFFLFGCHVPQFISLFFHKCTSDFASDFVFSKSFRQLRENGVCISVHFFFCTVAWHAATFLGGTALNEIMVLPTFGCYVPVWGLVWLSLVNV